VQLVRRVHAAAGLGDRAGGDRRRDPALDHVAERDPGDVLHHHVERATVLAEVVHRGDRRVVEPGEDRRLVEEHRPHRLGLGVRGEDRLDRDQLLERARAAPPAEQHRTHPAGLQLVEDLVGAESLGHGRGHDSATGAGALRGGLGPPDLGLGGRGHAGRRPAVRPAG